MSEEKIEMSTVDEHIPRYYKGYDMNILLTKALNNEPVSKDEETILLEAHKIYYKIYHEKNRKRAEEIMKQHEGELFVGRPYINNPYLKSLDETLKKGNVT